VQRRCDHDPRRPRLALVVTVADKLPLFLQDAIGKVPLLYSHPDRFPEITARAFVPRDVGRIRRRRSSRLEAIALVMLALLRRCDRRTLRVGDQRDDGLCNGVSVFKLAEQTGLTEARVSRAIAELEAAGYIRSAQAVEKYFDADGAERHRGFPAVRVVTPLMFRRLGVKPEKLKRAQANGYQAWTRRRTPPASAVQIHGARNALRRMTAPAAGRTRPETLPAAFYEAELRLRRDHPDWPYDRIRAEALRAVRPPPRN
jgi:hypothetical protein